MVENQLKHLEVYDVVVDAAADYDDGDMGDSWETMSAL